jgi:type IV pilus assembly protein PilA
MLQRLRNRARGQEGFTLIELLVVILIIGILAAVAIPTFLSQTSKAYDSNVESALGTVQNTEATYQTSNAGSYTTSASALETIEPSLTSPVTSDNMTFAFWAPTGTASATTGYKVVATDTKDSVAYTLEYAASTGSVTRTCTPANKGACSASGTWGS